MDIRIDDLRGAEIAALLAGHLDDMARHSPPESIHALDLDALRHPGITFWTAWDAGELLGCGALKALDGGSGEIKSMRTAPAHLRKGVAATLLGHIVEQARRRGYRRLWLETGTAPAFVPAHRLYARHGFRPCGPFGDYVADPYSCFWQLDLE
ncbi:GNAT family N-acetyltransferase [Flavobacterium sp. MXW15]|uniref:GNAT family N-acetyltransferase n=1 Tax=Xanthomonas chitinilytica TaxID=2989819 RepID=A0ABT3JUL1_9XANT|nr:GNAT family N-acetyltransferase [Xanthomonas sp. H13-6]MCW4453463.1 GNAT family N-acetyltransferase [Flavobacterium sp. MXW15]MCW4472184.1 GNAT family N-acetyltransferase [Xanthomonas sp. H13-6]